MKPKPLSSLNHFTVPVAMFPPRLVCCVRGGCWGATTAGAGTSLPRDQRGRTGLTLAGFARSTLSGTYPPSGVALSASPCGEDIGGQRGAGEVSDPTDQEQQPTGRRGEAA